MNRKIADSPDGENGAEMSPQQHRSKPREEGSSGRSKPRASYACLNCRQRKIKCSIDPIRKKCSSCKSLQIPCVISRDGDRRKLASREQISSLQDRLRYLEAVVAGQSHAVTAPNTNFQLAENGNEPGFNSDDHAPGDFVSPARHAEDLRRKSIHSYNGDVQQLPNSYDPQHDYTNGLGAQHDVGLHLNDHDPTLGQGTSPDVQVSEPINNLDQTDRQQPSPTDRDSPRLDVDEEGSQPRFYGPSSQRWIHDRSVPRDADLNGPHNDADADLNIDSAPVRNLLLQTFWKTQPLSQAIIDQMTFEMGRNNPTRSQYYSEFLENCILACATRMSTSPGIRTLGPKYAEQASSLVTRELQQPNIATLQGFLLLSDFEATRGRDRLGYMYSGIGCRMVFDLGLPESCSDLINRGKMSPAEGLSRHILFLGAFIYDKLWSLYLGRPSSIPLSHLTSAQRRIAQQGWDIPATLDSWVGLAADISEVTDILNSDTPLDWRSLDGLSELDARISQRCASMPEHLKLNENRVSDLPASAYGLNIQFRGIRIVLHRLLSKALTHNRNSIATPQRERIQHSRNVMRENAISIARMASVYQQIFGIENVITVMLDNIYVAAALLISHVLRTEQQDSMMPSSTSTEMDVRWLNCLADMLQKAQKHYPVTSRMRYTLCNLVAGTSLAGTFGSWSNGTAQGNDQTLALHPGDPFNVDFGGQVLSEQNDFLLQGPFDADQGLLFGNMDGGNMSNMMSWIFSPTESSKV